MNYRTAKVRLLAQVFATCFLLAPQCSFAATETIDPNVYGEVTINTSGWSLASPVFSVNVIQDPSNNIEKRAFMEYSLDSLSADIVVASATLELSVTFAGQGAIPVHGYAGDGIADLSDSIILPNSEIGASEVITDDSSTMNVALDVDYVQSLIGTGNHLGVLLLGSPNSMETTLGSLGVPPAKLVLSFSGSGDFNEDGIVDARDFLAWQRGESPDPFSASDLADWEAAYPTPIVAAVASVPEPASASLIALGMFIALARRSKHRQN